MSMQRAGERERVRERACTQTSPDFFDYHAGSSETGDVVVTERRLLTTEEDVR